jgi:hypothetical protein
MTFYLCSPSSRLLMQSVWSVLHPKYLKQCCGSVCFWASWIRIRLRHQIFLQSSKNSKKNLMFCDFFMTFYLCLPSSRLLRPSDWLVLHPKYFLSFEAVFADPYVFGPPGSGSSFGSFYYQAKIVRKT